MLGVRAAIGQQLLTRVRRAGIERALSGQKKAGQPFHHARENGWWTNTSLGSLLGSASTCTASSEL
jgi:hypothetical protein